MRKGGLSPACSSHVMLTDLGPVTLLLVALESRKESPLYYRASDMPTPNDLSSITEDTGVFHPFSITREDLWVTLCFSTAQAREQIFMHVYSKRGRRVVNISLYSSSILFFHSISD